MLGFGNRCAYCGKKRVRRSSTSRLCRSCEPEHLPVISNAVASLADARHAFEVSKNPEERRGGLYEVIRIAGELKAYEDRGIPTSLPTPSELLGMFEDIRAELESSAE